MPGCPRLRERVGRDGKDLDAHDNSGITSGAGMTAVGRPITSKHILGIGNAAVSLLDVHLRRQ
jgi:hypothetical protein